MEVIAAPSSVPAAGSRPPCGDSSPTAWPTSWPSGPPDPEGPIRATPSFRVPGRRAEPSLSPSEGARPVATTLDRLQPYVENVFDNEDLRANLARARANLHAARRRAESRKDFRKAA